MDKGRYLVEAHLREGRSVAELARTHGVHPSWIYRLLARHRELGDEGLKPRSRRPHRSPSAIADEVENEIVLLRKQLAEEGLDAGAHTIFFHLTRRHGSSPSVSTIMRVLRRRGCVVPEPKKRPRSSFIRFQAALPNECWQSDMTHWALRGDRGVEIVNIIDDHSRLCVGAVALAVTKALDVVEIFENARQHYGTPASVLSDNGAIYTAKYRGGKAALEIELERLGVICKHSSPYHPQTCGKVERFHQTMKKYLAKKPPARSLPELQRQIDTFVTYYNECRPHRGIKRRIPKEVFDAQVKAHPSAPGQSHLRIRRDKVDNFGKLTLRYEGRLRHIGVGARFKGQAVVLMIADAEVRILTPDGEPLRILTLDRTRDYHPQTLGWTSTMS
jgi:transposase InsO family protein